jgi:hypothetical protein
VSQYGVNCLVLFGGSKGKEEASTSSSRRGTEEVNREMNKALSEEVKGR